MYRYVKYQSELYALMVQNGWVNSLVKQVWFSEAPVALMFYPEGR